MRQPTQQLKEKPMDQIAQINPFHKGELEAQQRAGVGDVASWAGGFIRKFLPAQHQEFYRSLPFLVVSGEDASGHIWVTLLEGEEGFISSPDPYSLVMNTNIDVHDPLLESFDDGTEIGVIGIELASRRRNRFSGRLQKKNGSYQIAVKQSFGNCPQYITQRGYTRVPAAVNKTAQSSTELSSLQMETIAASDTLIIGTGHHGKMDEFSSGFDASHRGGTKGFVRVVDHKTLLIPDYAGNNFFNTIGNLLVDNRIGLVFVDFETGGLLHISGHAEVDWTGESISDPNARRAIKVTIDQVLERPNAMSLRWSTQGRSVLRLSVVDKKPESNEITSFYLAAGDGGALPKYRAGQHLPIEIQIPGQNGLTKRSYSLSGDPARQNEYRLTIKREELGLASRFMHDAVDVGSMIYASRPSGTFVIPDDHSPLVLISAGVGITPMVSMLHDALARNEKRSIWFVHGTQNSEAHVLRDEVDHLINSHIYASQHVFYSQPSEDDIKDRNHHHVGRISAKSILDLNPTPGTYYMLCGPAQFQSQIKMGLEAADIPSSHISFEVF